MAAAIEVKIEVDAQLVKYIDDAKAEGHEFNYTGRPLPDMVREMYERIKHLEQLLNDVAG